MFWNDKSGNIAIVLALMAPVLFGIAGAGLDYYRIYAVKGDLQDIADSAALGGARQIEIANGSPTIPKNIAEDIAKDGIHQSGVASASAAAVVDTKEASVTVTINHSYVPSLSVGMYKSPLPIEVS